MLGIAEETATSGWLGAKESSRLLIVCRAKETACLRRLLVGAIAEEATTSIGVRAAKQATTSRLSTEETAGLVVLGIVVAEQAARLLRLVIVVVAEQTATSSWCRRRAKETTRLLLIVLTKSTTAEQAARLRWLLIVLVVLLAKAEASGCRLRCVAKPSASSIVVIAKEAAATGRCLGVGTEASASRGAEAASTGVVTGAESTESWLVLGRAAK